MKKTTYSNRHPRATIEGVVRHHRQTGDIWGACLKYNVPPSTGYRWCRDAIGLPDGELPIGGRDERPRKVRSGRGRGRPFKYSPIPDSIVQAVLSGQITRQEGARKSGMPCPTFTYRMGKRQVPKGNSPCEGES